jgi:hypothetical protein
MAGNFQPFHFYFFVQIASDDPENPSGPSSDSWGDDDEQDAELEEEDNGPRQVEMSRVRTSSEDEDEGQSTQSSASSSKKQSNVGYAMQSDVSGVCC